MTSEDITGIIAGIIAMGVLIWLACLWGKSDREYREDMDRMNAECQDRLNRMHKKRQDDIVNARWGIND